MDACHRPCRKHCRLHRENSFQRPLFQNKRWIQWYITFPRWVGVGHLENQTSGTSQKLHKSQPWGQRSSTAPDCIQAIKATGDCSVEDTTSPAAEKGQKAPTGRRGGGGDIHATPCGSDHFDVNVMGSEKLLLLRGDEREAGADGCTVHSVWRQLKYTQARC